MANNKISGSYILQSAQKIADYELTGENRLATVAINAQKINLIDLSNGSQQDRYIDLITKNKVHVKGIRIITPGGAGLRACKNAATLWLNLYSNQTQSNLGLLSIIEIARFNEWQTINDYWEPYKISKEQYYNLGFSQGIINIDDFNIQEKYIGETVGFQIELMIDTAGIYLDNRIV